MIKTLYDPAIKEEGIKEGIRKGVKKGRIEGRKEGRFLVDSVLAYTTHKV